MTTSLTPVHFTAEADLATLEGTLVVFASGGGDLIGNGKAADDLTGGSLSRALADPGFKAKAGSVVAIGYPAGMAAKKVLVASLGDEPDRGAARKTGSAIAKALGSGDVLLAVEGVAETDLVAEMIYAITLRQYDFKEYKSAKDDDAPAPRAITA
ncbi:MAG: M17 family peptidase N-terminal domain-containing protein, partial [Pseudomonadota bacterium]